MQPSSLTPLAYVLYLIEKIILRNGSFDSGKLFISVFQCYDGSCHGKDRLGFLFFMLLAN